MMAWGELGPRVAVAAVGIPLGVLVIYAGGWILALLVAALAALGARELFELARAHGRAPFSWLGVPAAALLVAVAARASEFQSAATWAWGVILLVTLVALVATVWLRGPQGHPLDAVGTTLTGCVYAGGTLSFAILIRELPEVEGVSSAAWEGTVLLLFPLTVTWVADSAAYFAGKRWGRRKLLPSVSPGKTVVGSLAAVFGAVASAAAFGHFFLSELGGFGLTAVQVVLIGLAIGVAAQAGDLAESVLKRAAGVKDSGRLLPGHGGVLDRFDSLYVVLPLTYALLVLAWRPA